MKKLKFALLALVSGVLLSSCSNTGDKTDGISKSPNVKMDETFFNPLDIKEGIGDPWLYKHTDGYYYYSTTLSNESSVWDSLEKSVYIIDMRDNIYSPNITEGDYFTPYVIFVGMNDSTPVFHMITADVQF